MTTSEDRTHCSVGTDIAGQADKLLIITPRRKAIPEGNGDELTLNITYVLVEKF